ncbi:ABC transporter permease [Anaerovirgula multivorans]|nr:ABC transporter permease [Anaerovirgula multivorans]
MRRMSSFMQKEFIRAIRNNMILYGFLFPILLAVIMRMFLPSIEGMKLSIAVDAAVEQDIIAALGDYAEVELYETADLVKGRVERPDDIAGIIKDGDQYVVLLEGNEVGEAEEIATALMNVILSGEKQGTYEYISLEKDQSPMREIVASLLLLTAIVIGGMMIALNIVNEKESRAIAALSVSPLRMLDYFLAHTILCMIVAIGLALVSVFLFVGRETDIFRIIIAILGTTAMGTLLGYIIGGFADNLISAIAILKVAMLFFIGVPIGSVFVPEGLQWLLFLFPNYWAFQSYRNIFSTVQRGVGFELSLGITFIFSLLVLIPLFKTFKKQLQLR